MNHLIPTTTALALGLMAGLSSARPADAAVQKGAPVMIVGQISSQPREFPFRYEKKMQVAVGPERKDYTLHIGDAVMFDPSGKRVYASDMLDKFWVRAEGRLMNDGRRIDVERLWVLGKNDAAYTRSTHYQPALHHGFVERVAGERQTFRAAPALTAGERVTLVGEVSSQPRDIGFLVEKKMQVAIGPNKTDYTLHSGDAAIFNYHGEKASIDDIQDKMWVYAEGTVMDDPRRIKVTRLQVIGANQAGMKASRFARPGWDHGYLLHHSEHQRLFPK